MDHIIACRLLPPWMLTKILFLVESDKALFSKDQSFFSDTRLISAIREIKLEPITLVSVLIREIDLSVHAKRAEELQCI